MASSKYGRADAKLPRWTRTIARRDFPAITAPFYGWFTEGFDTLDLKEAKALLDELIY
jgi:hypothetical protein